jgi:hypothetical protein
MFTQVSRQPHGGKGDKAMNRNPNAQRGVSLIDVLVALVVVAVGILAIFNLQSQLFSGTSDAKARAEAVELARSRIESFRNHVNLDNVKDGDRFLAQLSGGGDNVTGINADFQRSWTASPIDGDTSSQEIVVTVRWQDPDGQTQTVALNTVVTFAELDDVLMKEVMDDDSQGMEPSLAVTGSEDADPGSDFDPDTFDPTDPENDFDVESAGDDLWWRNSEQGYAELIGDPDGDGIYEVLLTSYGGKINKITGALQHVDPNAKVWDSANEDYCAYGKNTRECGIRVLAGPPSYCVYPDLQTTFKDDNTTEVYGIYPDQYCEKGRDDCAIYSCFVPGDCLKTAPGVNGCPDAATLSDLRDTLQAAYGLDHINGGWYGNLGLMQVDGTTQEEGVCVQSDVAAGDITPFRFYVGDRVMDFTEVTEASGLCTMENDTNIEVCTEKTDTALQRCFDITKASDRVFKGTYLCKNGKAYEITSYEGINEPYQCNNFVLLSSTDNDCTSYVLDQNRHLSGEDIVRTFMGGVDSDPNVVLPMNDNFCYDFGIRGDGYLYVYGDIQPNGQWDNAPKGLNVNLDGRTCEDGNVRYQLTDEQFVADYTFDNPFYDPSDPDSAATYTRDAYRYAFEYMCTKNVTAWTGVLAVDLDSVSVGGVGSADCYFNSFAGNSLVATSDDPWVVDFWGGTEADGVKYANRHEVICNYLESSGGTDDNQTEEPDADCNCLAFGGMAFLNTRSSAECCDQSICRSAWNESDNTWTAACPAAACDYTVTATAGEGGSVSPESACVDAGEDLDVTVTPNTGYVATGVSGCNISTWYDAAHTYTIADINADCTLAAQFDIDPNISTFTVTANATTTGGSITPAETIVPENGTTSLSVTPENGYQIAGVTGCSGSLSGSSYTTGPITSNCTVEASFEAAVFYTVTANAGTGGTINPTSTSVAENATTTFTLSPASGYQTAGVTGCGGSWTSGNSYTTGPITSNCAVTASFEQAGTITIDLTVDMPSGKYASNAAQMTGGSCTLGAADNTKTSRGSCEYTGSLPWSGTISVSGVDDKGAECSGTSGVETYSGDASLTLTCTEGAQSPITVTATAGSGGDITPEGALDVSSGGTLSFTVSPDTGYEISGVSGCNGSWTSGSSNYTTGTITGNCTVTASFSPTAPASHTVTASASTGGSIDPAGTTSVNDGETTSFTIGAADVGYEFDGVSGSCGGTLSGTTYTTDAITGDCMVSADFSPIQYTVSASADPGGSLSPSGNTAVDHGTTTTFTIGAADAGYKFDGVSGSCGGSLSGDTYTTNAITSDCTVSADFSLIRYTVSTSEGSGGSISPSSVDVNHGATATFTIGVLDGYEIGSVSGCNGSLSGNTYTTGSITGVCTVSASFNAVGADTFTVTPGVSGTGGSISPSEPTTVSDGQTASFTLTPATNYQISGVSGSCGGSISGNTYTTNAISSDCTVTASFSEVPSYTITPSAGAGGAINPSVATAVYAGQTASFTLNPDTNYVVDGVSGSCGGSLSGNTYTTNAISADCSVTASFVRPSYTVATSVTTGNGSVSPISDSVLAGDTTEFTITPATGSQIFSVAGCSGSLSGNTFTTGPIDSNCMVSAAFTAIVYTVSPSVVDSTGGSISPATAQLVDHGDTMSFTLTPASGYEISGVTGSCGGSLSNGTYTTGPITGDCAVEASFEATITISLTVAMPSKDYTGNNAAQMTGGGTCTLGDADNTKTAVGNCIYTGALPWSGTISVSGVDSKKSTTCSGSSGVLTYSANDNLSLSCSAN